MDISFDKYGNLYLDSTKISNDPYFEKPPKYNIHQINVDGKNRPYIESGDFEIVSESKNSIKNLKLVNDNNFKKRVTDSVKDYESYFPEEEEYDYNLPNSEEYTIDEDSINKYGEDNLQFTFISTHISTPIYERKYGDVCALYDTYYYRAKRLQFISKSSVGDSIYRLNLYSNGSLFFRLLGSRNREYRVIIDKEGHMIIDTI